jgi:transposase
LLSVVVHAASIPDRKGGQWVLETLGDDTYPRLRHIWADQGYTGTLVRWTAQEHGWQVQVVYLPFRQLKCYAPELVEELGAEPRFRVIPRRWVVESTQPQYLQCALDVQTSNSHDRTRWVAQVA